MKKFSLSIVSRSSLRWLPYAGIALLVILLYRKTILFDFSYLDDNVLIINCFNFLKDASNVIRVFTRDAFYPFTNPVAYYRPVLTLSFMADAKLFGLCPSGYHSTNIFLHIIASCLVYAFLRKMGYDKMPSFLVTCVFAVHPAVSQAVAWIPGRNDSILACCILASFIALIDFVKTGNRKNYAWHLMFFTLALFTKESALALIPLAIVYLCTIGKKDDPLKKGRHLFYGWGAVALFWMYLRHRALKDAAQLSTVDFDKSAALIMPAIIQYIGKVIVPVNLSVTPILVDTSLLYGYCAAALLIALLLRSRTKDPALMIFGLSWFLIFLFPFLKCSNAGAIVSDFSEHRLYLPLAGFAIVMLESGMKRSVKIGGIFVLAISALVVTVLAAVTYRHIDTFRDRVSFWENAVTHSPHSPLAHRVLGGVYQMEGRSAEAMAEFRTSIALDPQEPFVHNMLGKIYMSEGRFVEAEKEYGKEAVYNPLLGETYVNRGTLFYKQKKMEEAEISWKKALEIDPDDINAHKNLAIFYCEQKRSKETLYHIGRLRDKGVTIPEEFLNKVQETARSGGS